MARKVTASKDEDREWYIVDIDDNRAIETDKQLEEAFSVQVSPMSATDLKKAERQGVQTTSNKTQDWTAVFNDRTWKLKKRVLGEHVHKVKNYQIQLPSGEILTPVNGQQLVDAIHKPGVPASELAVLEDIYAAIVDRSKLDAGSFFHLKSSLVSSSQETSE